MWKIDSAGNAYNERGEIIFVRVGVLCRPRISCTNWLGDFDTVEEAREFINVYVAREIYIEIGVLKQERGCGGHRHWLGDFKTVDDAKDFICQTVAKLNSEETK